MHQGDLFEMTAPEVPSVASDAVGGIQGPTLRSFKRERQADASEILLEIVGNVWADQIRVQRDGRARPPTIRMGKLKKNVLSFLDLMGLTGRPLNVLMAAAIGLYGREFCKRTFKRSYPPFSLVTSARCRDRVLEKYRAVHGDSLENLASQAAGMAKTLLSSVGLAGVRELLRGGWPSDANLLRCLEQEVARADGRH